MAKKKEEKTGKITFGVRKGGKHQKSKGPKDKNVSEYRGQGR
jgi:hypothetical protein